MTSVSWVIWWIIVVAGLLVGATLILLGYYLFGAIIGGFAILRLIYTLSLPGRRGPWLMTDSERALLRSIARDEFVVAAGVMGISVAQLRDDFRGGLSLAEMARGAGVALDAVIDAIVKDAATRIDHAVAVGSVTQREGDSAKARLRPWAARLVNLHRKDLPSLR